MKPSMKAASILTTIASTLAALGCASPIPQEPVGTPGAAADRVEEVIVRVHLRGATGPLDVVELDGGTFSRFSLRSEYSTCLGFRKFEPEPVAGSQPTVVGFGGFTACDEKLSAGFEINHGQGAALKKLRFQVGVNRTLASSELREVELVATRVKGPDDQVGLESGESNLGTYALEEDRETTIDLFVGDRGRLHSLRLLTARRPAAVKRVYGEPIGAVDVKRTEHPDRFGVFAISYELTGRGKEKIRHGGRLLDGEDVGEKIRKPGASVRQLHFTFEKPREPNCTVTIAGRFER
jgi:hypothetical protein